jgi:EAL domain-containing protein (putative c-di-GMP-specific phosphodiesterase class I)
MHNVEATAQRLHAIKQLGVKIAIDDFGTGYSSLAYLRQFPVDCLKIDRMFTSAVTTSPESEALIKTLVQLVRTWVSSPSPKASKPLAKWTCFGTHVST